MKIFGWEFRRAVAQALPEEKQNQFESVLQRLVAAQNGLVNGVTPENCMESPTVHAIVTAITRRFAVTPVHVYQKTLKKGRYLVACIDEQTVFVGTDCFSIVRKGGWDGYQPPRGGPRLFTIEIKRQRFAGAA